MVSWWRQWQNTDKEWTLQFAQAFLSHARTSRAQGLLDCKSPSVSYVSSCPAPVCSLLVVTTKLLMEWKQQQKNWGGKAVGSPAWEPKKIASQTLSLAHLTSKHTHTHRDTNRDTQTTLPPPFFILALDFKRLPDSAKGAECFATKSKCANSFQVFKLFDFRCVVLLCCQWERKITTAGRTRTAMGAHGNGEKIPRRVNETWKKKEKGKPKAKNGRKRKQGRMWGGEGYTRIAHRATGNCLAQCQNRCLQPRWNPIHNPWLWLQCSKPQHPERSQPLPSKQPTGKARLVQSRCGAHPPFWFAWSFLSGARFFGSLAATHQGK